MESGMCSLKNEVNIMCKNVLDIALGGFTFWILGYGLVYGTNPLFTTRFYGIGDFFFSPDINLIGSGEAFLKFFLQTAFISTSNYHRIGCNG